LLKFGVLVLFSTVHEGRAMAVQSTYFEIQDGRRPPNFSF